MCVCKGLDESLNDNGSSIIKNLAMKNMLEFGPQMLVRGMWAWDSQPSPASHLAFEC